MHCAHGRGKERTQYSVSMAHRPSGASPPQAIPAISHAVSLVNVGIGSSTIDALHDSEDGLGMGGVHTDCAQYSPLPAGHSKAAGKEFAAVQEPSQDAGPSNGTLVTPLSLQVPARATIPL